MEIECVMFDWMRTCVILNVCVVPHQEKHLCALIIHKRGVKQALGKRMAVPQSCTAVPKSKHANRGQKQSRTAVPHSCTAVPPVRCTYAIDFGLFQGRQSPNAQAPMILHLPQVPEPFSSFYAQGLSILKTFTKTQKFNVFIINFPSSQFNSNSNSLTFPLPNSIPIQIH